MVGFFVLCIGVRGIGIVFMVLIGSDGRGDYMNKDNVV